MTPLPTQATVIARTPRLVLRTWTERDLEPIAALWCDPEAMRFAGPLADLAAVRRALTAATRVQAERGVCLWAIEEPRTGHLIGDCGFHARPKGLSGNQSAIRTRPRVPGAAYVRAHFVDAPRGAPSSWAVGALAPGTRFRVLRRSTDFLTSPKPDTFELAYHLLPAAWGQGHATEAARAAIEYAFTHLAARRLFAWVDPQNPASAAVLRRCGFTEHGPDPDEGGEVRHELTR